MKLKRKKKERSEEKENRARSRRAFNPFWHGSRDRPVTFSFYSAVLFSLQFHSLFGLKSVHRMRARSAAIKSTSAVSGIDNRSRECNGQTISRFNVANGRQALCTSGGKTLKKYTFRHSWLIVPPEL